MQLKSLFMRTIGKGNNSHAQVVLYFGSEPNIPEKNLVIGFKTRHVDCPCYIQLFITFDCFLVWSLKLGFPSILLNL